jgi:hypothetical protein
MLRDTRATERLEANKAVVDRRILKPCLRHGSPLLIQQTLANVRRQLNSVLAALFPVNPIPAPPGRPAMESQ